MVRNSLLFLKNFDFKYLDLNLLLEIYFNNKSFFLKKNLIKKPLKVYNLKKINLNKKCINILYF